jgi:hypothetical protein
LLNCQSWSQTCDPSALASHVLGITGIYYHIWLDLALCVISGKTRRSFFPQMYIPLFNIIYWKDFICLNTFAENQLTIKGV